MFWLNKIFRFTLSILIISVLISCGRDKVVFEQYKDFHQNTWNRFTHLEYYMDIEASEQPYNIYLDFELTPSFEFNRISFCFVVKAPSGDERFKDYIVRINENHVISEEENSENIVRIHYPVKEEYYFNESGKYKFIVENLMEKLHIYGVQSVGLIVEKADKSSGN